MKRVRNKTKKVPAPSNFPPEAPPLNDLSQDEMTPFNAGQPRHQPILGSEGDPVSANTPQKAGVVYQEVSIKMDPLGKKRKANTFMRVDRR